MEHEIGNMKHMAGEGVLFHMLHISCSLFHTSYLPVVHSPPYLQRKTGLIQMKALTRISRISIQLWIPLEVLLGSGVRGTKFKFIEVRRVNSDYKMNF